MIIMYPVKIEAHDEESHDGLFTVECFDEGAAKVIIDSVVNVALWDEIAPKIREALVMMQLEGDTK